MAFASVCFSFFSIVLQFSILVLWPVFSHEISSPAWRERIFLSRSTQFTLCFVCFVDNILSRKRNIFWPLLQCWIRRGRRERAEATTYAQAQKGEPEWSLFIWLDMTSDPLILTHHSLQVILKAQRKEFHYRWNLAYSPDIRFINRLIMTTWPVKFPEGWNTCCVWFINWQECWRSIGIWRLLMKLLLLGTPSK